MQNPGPIFFGAGDHVITSSGHRRHWELGRGRAGPRQGCWLSAACGSARPGSRPPGFRRTAFLGARRRRAFPSMTSPRTAPGPSPTWPQVRTACCTRLAVALDASASGSPPMAWPGRPWPSRPPPPGHRLAPGPGRGRRSHDRASRQPAGPALRPGPTKRVLARAERDGRVRQPSPHSLADQSRERPVDRPASDERSAPRPRPGPRQRRELGGGAHVHRRRFLADVQRRRLPERNRQPVAARAGRAPRRGVEHQHARTARPIGLPVDGGVRQPVRGRRYHVALRAHQPRHPR